MEKNSTIHHNSCKFVIKKTNFIKLCFVILRELNYEQLRTKLVQIVWVGINHVTYNYL